MSPWFIDLVCTSKIVLSLLTWQTFGDYPMYHGVVCLWIFHVFYALYGSVVHVWNFWFNTVIRYYTCFMGLVCRSKIVQTYSWILQPMDMRLVLLKTATINVSWCVILEILWQHKAMSPKLFMDLDHRGVDSCCKSILLIWAPRTLICVCQHATIQYDTVLATCMYLAQV